MTTVSEPPAATGPGPGRGRLPSSLLVPATLAAFLLLWEGGVRLLQVPAFILPPPSAVVGKAGTDLASGVIFPHLWQTLTEILAGFTAAALCGTGLGTAIALVPALRRTLYPFVLASQTIPKVAIAPLFIIWFGYGIQSKIVTVALIAFFPIIVNVIVGLETVDPRRLLLMRALKGSAWQTYLKVRLPSMLPFLFAGLEIAIIFSVIGAIVAEFIGASVGLGSVIIQRQAAVDVAGVFSVLVYLSVMGIVLNLILKLIARPFAFWSRSKDVVGA
jgi:NitT/TauT family transport system permease protein